MRTIQQQLLIWLIGSMLAATAIAGVAQYFIVQDEANELYDELLERIADALPTEHLAQSRLSNAEDDDEHIVVQIWDQAGALIYSSHSQQQPRLATTGFNTVVVNDHTWRVYSETRADRFIQVAQETAERDQLMFQLSMRALLPFLVLMPVLALLIGVVVGRSLRPLQHIAQAVGQRSASAMQPLSNDGIPREIWPMVDALNNLLARLAQALAAQTAFVADAAHELRSPLAALKLQLQLAERAKTAEDRNAAFTKLHARVDRSTHLVRQLLTLAHHEPQMAERVFEALSLGQLAQQVVADHDALANSKGIDLGAEVTTVPMVVRGHWESLRIMLGNLVDNALRYTPKGGSVDVIALVQDGHPMLQVVDNGPGIPPHDRPKVFERFFRGVGVEAPGSGLGLAIVKNIADQHGATVYLSDNPLGGGLVATVSFQFRGEIPLRNSAETTDI